MGKSCLTMWSKLVNIAFLLPCILFSKRSDLTALNKDRGEILGGIDAEYAEFPHQVVLLRGGVGGSSMCSGSLLSPSIIVTAGHCCDGQLAAKLAVRVGNYHTYEEDPDQADIPVKTIILHEDYDSWTVENDICLLELERSTSQVLCAVCLAGVTYRGEDQGPLQFYR